MSYRCTSTVKKNVINDIVTGGRPIIAAYDVIGLAYNDVAQPLAGCIFGSNGLILILFVAKCSKILIDSLRTIKSNYEHGPIFRRYGPLKMVVP